jgi:hypothetical protein
VSAVKVTPSAAMRARDVSRPGAEHVGWAEAVEGNLSGNSLRAETAPADIPAGNPGRQDTAGPSQRRAARAAESGVARASAGAPTEGQGAARAGEVAARADAAPARLASAGTPGRPDDQRARADDQRAPADDQRARADGARRRRVRRVAKGPNRSSR